MLFTSYYYYILENCFTDLFIFVRTCELMENCIGQDTGSLPKFDACCKLENGKVCVMEPLDCLLSCVSWILLFQPHDKSDNPSQHSWPCFGFSISQENEVTIYDMQLRFLV